jgi:hypothetical protein
MVQDKAVQKVIEIPTATKARSGGVCLRSLRGRCKQEDHWSPDQAKR